MEKFKMQLTDSIKAKIDKALTKYPPDQKQSAVKSALMLMQKENDGYLTEDLMDLVADYLEIPRASVYEVATFYTMFELEPVGRHKISICTNISCKLRGCDSIVKHLQDKLKIGWDEVTIDGKFSLKEVECMGACTNAPMMEIGEKYFENLTTEQVDEILARLK